MCLGLGHSGKLRLAKIIKAPGPGFASFLLVKSQQFALDQYALGRLDWSCVLWKDSLPEFMHFWLFDHLGVDQFSGLGAF